MDEYIYGNMWDLFGRTLMLVGDYNAAVRVAASYRDHLFYVIHKWRMPEYNTDFVDYDAEACNTN